MLCVRCNKRVQQNSLPHLKSLCNSCCARIIEKRIRKYIRANKYFKRGDRILVIDSLTYHTIKEIIGGLPARVFKKISPISQISGKSISHYIKNNKINKVVIPWSLDDENNLYMEKMIFNKNNYFNLRRLNQRNIIKLFIQVTDKEIELLSNIKQIGFKANKKNEIIQRMLNNLENRYPEIRFNILKHVKNG